MKLSGSMRGKDVIVLIGNGETHDFIHYKLMDELKLPITKETKFGVNIGDSIACEGHGICKRVEVKLTKLTIVEDFLAIDLGKMDVILGMRWLLVILKGDPSLTEVECSIKALAKTCDEDDQSFLIEFQNVEIETV
ncbi:pleiotropic drug resistance protein 1-like [Cucumis melo var. makuwa]|uniref:Pleiotropic drug resistance protein 1-like n=1 Tax=Cucumis melo var. makuwa TaxID=1194695 RepID=A0A5A7TK47_CUCMM|nr:pleiotropic drug resistance protein 1-like [Cucumis melo var. makuwa]TYK15450.1 pleiotropic drug resistance protein 1-like [Cucumis melo var. makuwa]